MAIIKAIRGPLSNNQYFSIGEKGMIPTSLKVISMQSWPRLVLFIVCLIIIYKISVR